MRGRSYIRGTFTMAMTAKEKRDARAAAKAAGQPTPLEIANSESTLHPDKVRDAHGEVAKPKSSGAKVIVACKVGLAFIDLQLSKFEEVYENTQTGPRLVKQAKRFGVVVRIRGTAYPRGTPPAGFPERPKMAAGAALTYGIDKEFWDEWVRQNHLSPMVINNMVFADESEDRVVGRARELIGEVSGFDPVNPLKDARLPKSTNPGVSNIETEETRAAKQRLAQGAA